MIEEIRDLFQTLIAPQLESLKGDIKALDIKIDTKIEGLETKIAGLDTKIAGLDTRIAGLDTKIDWKIESLRREFVSEIRRVEGVLSTDFVRLEQKVDLRLENLDTKLGAMNENLELHRRELLAEIKAALK